jgi:hypothetical protein
MPFIVSGLAPLVGFVGIVVLWGPPGDAKPHMVRPPSPPHSEGAFHPASDFAVQK